MGQSQATTRFEDWDFRQKVKMAQSSTVWRAVYRQTEEVAAVKQMGNSRRQHAEREISMLRAVSHPNIIRLHSVFEDQDSIYLALEYFDGCNLAEKVKECGLNLKEEGVAKWMQQMLSAVAHLHSTAICHRHIMPDSFMVHKEVLKLSDFGLAVFLQRGELLNERCGPPAFMAPEQHMRKGYSLPCDVWAAGVTMFSVMLGGQHPFFNGGGQLDEKRLCEGTLDFSVPLLFGITSFSKERFSELARQLCRRMVEPAVAKRISAEVALQDPWFQQQGKSSSTSEARVAFAELPMRRDGNVAQLASSPRAKAASMVSTPAPARSAASRKCSKESWWARSGPENSPPTVPQPGMERSVTGRTASKESTGWWQRGGVENASPNIQHPATERSVASRKGSKEAFGFFQTSPSTAQQQPVARRTERRVTTGQQELSAASVRRDKRTVTISGAEFMGPKESTGWSLFGAAETSPQAQRPAQPMHRAERQSSIESELATSLMGPSSRKSSSSWWPLSSAENADPNAQPAASAQAPASQWPGVLAKRHLSFEAALEL